MKELRDQKVVVYRVAAEVMKEQGVKVKYHVGTMIEVPRGSITADQIATEAQFFSFGTNDLTQLAYGFSRDDVGKFLRIYQTRRSSTGIRSRRSIPKRRGVGGDGVARPQDAARPEARDLRRAWRRPGIDPLLPHGRPRLRQRIALPDPGGGSRGAGRALRQGRRLTP